MNAQTTLSVITIPVWWAPVSLRTSPSSFWLFRRLCIATSSIWCCICTCTVVYSRGCPCRVIHFRHWDRVSPSAVAVGSEVFESTPELVSGVSGVSVGLGDMRGVWMRISDSSILDSLSCDPFACVVVSLSTQGRKWSRWHLTSWLSSSLTTNDTGPVTSAITAGSPVLVPKFLAYTFSSFLKVFLGLDLSWAVSTDIFFYFLSGAENK